MRPNIFIVPHNREDAFSHSLAYILNIFPVLGDAQVRRIAILAGKDAEQFGRFQACEFVAHEFSRGHIASRPDLKIVCSNSIVYFENNLDAPLSVSQMERHAVLARTTPKCYLVFVSNITHRSLTLRSIPRYIHPTGRDHYLWVDLLPALSTAYRKSTVPAILLDDFRTALERHGMIGRTIKGASGSLYTTGSEACHLALRQLAEQLEALGFTLDRKRPQESTLRIRPSRETPYPLLNPRFEPTATWLARNLDFECLVFTTVSRTGRSLISRRLTRFRSQRDCMFVPECFESGGYTYHGRFVVPLTFDANGTTSSIDFNALRSPFKRMLTFLTTSFTAPKQTARGVSLNG